MLGGGGVSHPSQLTTGLVIKSVTTSPTLAGERMLFILQVSILSEQTQNDDDQREFQPKISTSSLKTQKKSIMKENREPKFTAPPPPPFSQKIRKSHYVCIDIYDIIHKYETLNVNKVNS